MAFREAQQFDEIIEEIEKLVNWFDTNKLSEKSTKIYLSNGEKLTFKVRKEHIAHLLGINIDFLIGTRMFNSTSSYELLKEFIDNAYRFSSKINSNDIKLSNLFKPEIYRKIRYFKDNINISVDKTLFICSYNSKKQYEQGQLSNKCDYIIVKELDDGTILQLDLVKEKNNTVVPMSNKSYDDLYDADQVFYGLLKNQKICMLSSIQIINNNDYYYPKTIYQNAQEKIAKLDKLEFFEKKYDCNTSLISDFRYMCKKNSNNDYEIMNRIIAAMMEQKEIKPSKLGINVADLKEYHKDLINAFNDVIIMGNTEKNGEKKYSDLQKQIKELKDEKRSLESEIRKKNDKIENIISENCDLKQENKGAKQLVKTFKIAIADYEAENSNE